jgi:hypothetical protein
MFPDKGNETLFLVVQGVGGIVERGSHEAVVPPTEVAVNAPLARTAPQCPPLCSTISAHRPSQAAAMNSALPWRPCGATGASRLRLLGIASRMVVCGPGLPGVSDQDGHRTLLPAISIQASRSIEFTVVIIRRKVKSGLLAIR